MLKTLKPSEKEILVEKNFLAEYFIYLQSNPGSLLMKIFGVFDIQIGSQSELSFLITENMVGDDARRVYRCYDLKGSRLNREVKLSKKETESGSGTKPLKDLNFLEFQEKKPLDLPEFERGQLLA